MTADIHLVSPTGLIACTIRPHGATISHLIITDPVTGVKRDVVQGFDSLEEQLAADKDPNPYYGTVGRVCNRIANGKFTLNNKTYTLPINNGPNSLHGGLQGFDKKLWTPTQATPTTVTLTLHSPHNDENYPLPLLTTLTYTLTETPTPTLTIDYKAEIIESDLPTTDETSTLVNLTTHSYFNLTGFTDPTIHTHRLEIPNSTHLQLSPTQIPTGKRVSDVRALDFSSPKMIGRDLEEVMEFKGYDHYFFCNPRREWGVVARVLVEGGMGMEVWTDAAGFQLYTGNWLDGRIGPKASTQKGG
ncbi:hypothetical protein HDU67_000390 [Dinochytrium kinnereticum]|nr:hypothetical protein HDU67_000390 [Dinochytrium kinnereticum]